MSDTNEREEALTFDAFIERRFNCKFDALGMVFPCDLDLTWQAATSASYARYQAIVLELEEVLQANHKWHQANDEYEGYGESELCEINCKALSTTTPDTALQRKVLEARIDERLNPTGFYTHNRIEELRAQLAALGE